MKLLQPLVRAGTICRAPLLDRLTDGDPRRIVSVVAPPGYGKTTLLSQWAEQSAATFAWVLVDEGTTGSGHGTRVAARRGGYLSGDLDEGDAILEDAVSAGEVIHRELGASSRNQAVTRSRELGLLDG